MTIGNTYPLAIVMQQHWANNLLICFVDHDEFSVDAVQQDARGQVGYQNHHCSRFDLHSMHATT